jgi:hypothetical protein
VVRGQATADQYGTAEVAAADPASLGIGDSIALSSWATGTVSPTGTARSAALTDGIVWIFNDSPFAALFSFMVTYSLQATTSAPGPQERAGAEASVGVYASYEELLFDVARSETSHGGGAVTLSKQVAFDVMVGPIDFGQVCFLADTRGRAVAAVPEPPTWGVVGLGFAVVALWGRVRRALPVRTQA